VLWLLIGLAAVVALGAKKKQQGELPPGIDWGAVGKAVGKMGPTACGTADDPCSVDPDDLATYEPDYSLGVGGGYQWIAFQGAWSMVEQGQLCRPELLGHTIPGGAQYRCQMHIGFEGGNTELPRWIAGG